MGSTRLVPRRIEKLWGRRDLAPWFESVPPTGEPVGEVWFEWPGGDRDLELLVKFLFTAERLSVQVHPDDAAAHALGEKRGKNEAWYVLDAEPHATIGLGMREVVSPERLRQSALDGSIVALMHWEAVKPQDCYFAPAGTVHAIGGGLKLVEIQQNSDTTYRLYDYGRPRELHLEAGVAAADPTPWVASTLPRDLAPGRRLLVSGPAFVMEKWHTEGAGTLMPPTGQALQLVVLAGGGSVDGCAFRPGEVWLIESRSMLQCEGKAEFLLAYPGECVAEDLWSPEPGAVGERPVASFAAAVAAKGTEMT